MAKKLTDTIAPIHNPPVPEDESPLKKSGFKQLTAEQLEELAMQDPNKAQVYLDLYEKLAKKRVKEVNEESLIKTQTMLLKKIQEQAEIEFRNQKACEQRGHMREDNRSALVGQRDNFHEILLVCQRCQKSYHGLGDAKGQLPTQLISTLDTSLIGGVQ